MIARVIVDYKNKFEKNHALINRVFGATSDVEQKELMRISSNSQIQAVVLPIRSVGVQGKHNNIVIIIIETVVNNLHVNQVTNAPTVM